MATLNGTTPAATYPSLIKFDDNSAISAALRLLSDGSGNATPLWLSQTQLNIGGAGTINAKLGVKGTGNTSGTTSFRSENSDNTSSLNFSDSGTLTLTSSTSTICIIGAGIARFYNIQSLGGFGLSQVNLSGLMDLYSNDGTLGVRINDAYTGIADATAIGQTTAPAASAMIDIVSTTKGALLPRMTTTQVNAIVAPATGLIVYNTTLNLICFYNGTSWLRIPTTTLM